MTFSLEQNLYNVKANLNTELHFWNSELLSSNITGSWYSKQTGSVLSELGSAWLSAAMKTQKEWGACHCSGVRFNFCTHTHLVNRFLSMPTYIHRGGRRFLQWTGVAAVAPLPSCLAPPRTHSGPEVCWETDPHWEQPRCHIWSCGQSCLVEKGSPKPSSVTTTELWFNICLLKY